MNKLIIISAPSGAGKTTLCKRLLKEFPDKLEVSISSTTRAPRGEEKNGDDYFFITKEQFEKEIKDNNFSEWALVHGNYYGTTKAIIENTFKSGKSVLLDIDVQGANSLHKNYQEKCIRFFITTPNLNELRVRLQSRGTDSEEVIEKRIKNAESELEKAKEFDYTIINENIDTAYQKLKDILFKELNWTLNNE